MPQIQTYDQQTSAPNTSGLPNVQAVSTPDYINQGISQLGQSLSNVGQQTATAGINQQIYDQQRAKQDATLKATNLLSKAQIDFNSQKLQLQNQAPLSGTGLTQNYSDYMNNYKQQFLDNSQDKLLNHEFSNKIDELIAKQTIGMQDIENKAYTNYQMQTFKDTNNNLVTDTAQSGGANFSQNIELGAQNIDNLNLPPEDKIKLHQDLKNSMIEGTAQSNLINNPRQLNADIGVKLGKIQPGSGLDSLVNETTKLGGSPLTAIAIASVESGGVNNIKNPIQGSSAYGILQFTDATWKALGGTDENRSDPNVQAQLGAKLIMQNQNGLQASLGRQPSIGEIAAANQFGLGTTQQMIQANPNTPIENFISPDTATKNNISGLTTGQVLDKISNNVNSKLQPYMDSDKSYVNAMDIKQQIKWYNASNTAMNKQDGIANSIFDTTVNAQKAQAMNGDTVTQKLDYNSFLNRYKDTTLANFHYDEYNNALKLGNDISSMSGQTAAERAQIYNSLPYEKDSIYAGEQLKIRQQYQTAMQNMDKALQTDPSDYFNKSDPYIKNLYNQVQQNPTDQTVIRNYLTAQSLAQTKQGINVPQLLSSNDQANIVKQISGTQGLDTAKVVQNISMQYGHFWPQVVSQMQNNKSLPTGISSIMTAPTSEAADEASLVRNTPFQDLVKALPATIKTTDINNSISNALQNWKDSMSVNEINSKYATDTQSTIQKIVYDKVRLGMDPDDAATSTINMFVGNDKYQYIKQNTGTLRVPKGANADLINQASKDIVNTLGINDVYFGDVKALKNPWYLSDNADGYLSQIKNNSYWKTSSDDQKANLFFLGSDNRNYPVLDKSGKQISKTFLELQPTKPIMTYTDSIFE